MIPFLKIFLRYFEYLIFSVGIVVLVLLFVRTRCIDSQCEVTGFSSSYLFVMWGSIIVLYGIVSSARTTCSYLLSSHSGRMVTYDLLYVISIVSQTISFALLGFFLKDLVIKSQIAFMSSPVLIVLVLSLCVSGGALLFDKKFWVSSILFVRARLVMALIIQLLLILNPILALIAACIIVPIATFWRETE